jgi:hypothetical protein
MHAVLRYTVAALALGSLSLSPYLPKRQKSLLPKSWWIRLNSSPEARIKASAPTTPKA